jgi:hypothetical protein
MEASITKTTASASARVLVTMAFSRDPSSLRGLWTPGVSIKTIWRPGRDTTPRMTFLVVWGRVEVIATLDPTI